MNPIRHISRTLCKVSSAAWGMLLGCLCLIGGNALGQEVTVHDAVITIPEGTHFNTDGGITLQGEGGIDNHGVIELKGDWINDGQGLLTAHAGKVVMDGAHQMIAGSQPSAFHDLVLEGKGEKELAANVKVAGALTVRNCAVITHGYAFLIPDADPQKVHLENGAIFAEKISFFGSATLQSAPVSPLSLPTAARLAMAAAAAPSASASRLKIKKTSLAATASAGACAAHAHDSQPASALRVNQLSSLSGSARAALLTMYHHSATIGEASFSASFPATVCMALVAGHTTGWNASLEQARMLNLGSACAFAVLDQHLTGFFYTA